jgi:hypothetical protein
MTRRILLFALACSAGFAADQNLLKMIPDDARVVVGLDADRAVNSPFGRFILSQMSDDEGGLAKFVALTGFDPRRDLREAIFYGTGTGKSNGVFVAKGVFDISKIVTAAKSEGGSTLVYQGFNVITGKNPDQEWIAFLDSTLAVGGAQESVKAAIARRNSGSINATYRDLSSRFDAWMYTVEPAALGKAMPGKTGGNNPAETFKSVTAAQGGLRLGNSVDVDALATARSDKDAIALHDVIKFVAGMIQLKSDDASAAEVASLLESMKLSVSGNQVSLKLSIPETQIEQLFQRSNRRQVAQR